ncbi:unnamed protein product [Rotaria magnacalcarata]|uniref:Uncharacterized protein n=1 Tax=Rotaria magnacalcarata TaxID=392030 RepID=A0A820HIY7_9BILA|nr:unnamed protein product [Rotaria magnacalcarata]
MNLEQELWLDTFMDNPNSKPIMWHLGMHQTQTQTQTVWEFGFGQMSFCLGLGLVWVCSNEFGFGFVPMSLGIEFGFGFVPMSLGIEFGFGFGSMSLGLGLAYNRRFSTRISKKHPNVWTFIKLIQSENVRLEHIIAQLSGGASSSKQSKNTTGFQKRFETLKKRFNDNEINAKQLLKGLALLLGSHKKRK